VARTSTYLHFSHRKVEEAFTFYKSVFGTEFSGPIVRFGDLPFQTGESEMSDEVKSLIMNVTLPITGGHLLMGNDTPESMGVVNQGNNMDICIDPDTRAEADRIFAALSEGGNAEAPLQDFGDDYFGTVVDKFGTQWMVYCTARS
jgi:PhnB protein